ncbi:MAG TPA: hypothetical protein VKW04_11665 [Planctomycetota bacterium]|nr:hypothetical protein [Planctomycetota bacterium]
MAGVVLGGMDWVAGVALAVVLGVGWVLYQYSQTRRDLDLEAVARRLGLHFRSSLPAELRELLPRFRAIETAMERGGDFRAGINSITGSWRDRKIAFFDYEWITVLPLPVYRSWWRGGYSPDSYRRTHRRSAVAIELGVGLQPVLIRPEHLLDKALAWAGYEDIDFDRLPEFSRAFYVNSPDRAAAERLVTSTLAAFFLENVRCTVDVVGPWMLLHEGRLLPARRVQDRMDLAGRLSELVTREQSGSR